MIAQLRNYATCHSESPTPLNSISSVVLGEIVEKRKLIPKEDPSSRSGKLDSVSDDGPWTEQIDGTLPALQSNQNDQWAPVKVPSNYGEVCTR